MDPNQQTSIWNSSPPRFVLGTDEVHVWKVNLNLDAEKISNYYDLLCEEERVRANRFIFEKDRIQFVVGRGVLRKLLGQYLKENPLSIVFEYGKNGKPQLEDKYSLQFNLSNSAGVALIGFTQHSALGVDVEFIKPDIDLKDLALRFFSKNESEKLFSLLDSDIPEAFYNCWTRKEAFIKAKGDGLSFPLDQFEVSLIPGKAAELIATYWSPLEKKKWGLFAFEVEKEYPGALAIERPTNQIEFFKWQE